MTGGQDKPTGSSSPDVRPAPLHLSDHAEASCALPCIAALSHCLQSPPLVTAQSHGMLPLLLMACNLMVPIPAVLNMPAGMMPAALRSNMQDCTATNRYVEFCQLVTGGVHCTVQTEQPRDNHSLLHASS